MIRSLLHKEDGEKQEEITEEELKDINEDKQDINEQERTASNG